VPFLYPLFRLSSFNFANPFLCNQSEQGNSQRQIKQSCHTDLPGRKLARVTKYEDKYWSIQAEYDRDA
jgi:hypothetical protein